VTLHQSKELSGMESLLKKSILVTGASSGIGYAVAVHLAAKGYTVLATMRKIADIEKIYSVGMDNLKPLWPFDLTRPEQITAAADSLTELINTSQIPELYAIINIAGGGQIAPVELMNIDDYRNELEKRLVGPVILLQKLIPLLRATRGRIIWIATPGLFPAAFIADIHAPDFAVNYLARTLNLELYPDGIRNILIRCGGIDTPSPGRTEENLTGMLETWPEGISSIYKERLHKFLENSKKFNARRTNPGKVAELIARVLESRKPRIRYQIGYMSGLGGFLETLPQSWVDLIMKLRERS
jgi:NAD(P)-dependent dehydrogenase (short-subunit alcohol dehydrogenase family)